jgi:hypothetical protein
MADIVIRGMEMPKIGEILCINIFPDRKVTRQLDLSCEQIATAIPLPEGHGRLKDSRYIIDTIKETYCSACACSPTSFNCQLCKITKVIEIIENASTIVPAEGGIDNG